MVKQLNPSFAVLTLTLLPRVPRNLPCGSWSMLGWHNSNRKEKTTWKRTATVAQMFNRDVWKWGVHYALNRTILAAIWWYTSGFWGYAIFRQIQMFQVICNVWFLPVFQLSKWDFCKTSWSCVMLWACCLFGQFPDRSDTIFFQTPRKDLWWMGEEEGQEARNPRRDSASKTYGLTSSWHIKHPNQGIHWACPFFF